ncbi:ty3-gypsy retrotransposon protein [Tanacetum coccineum]
MTLKRMIMNQNLKVGWVVWKEIGYDGWTLDYVRGFLGGYVREYMEANAHRQMIIDRINDSNGTTRVFDVTTEEILHSDTYEVGCKKGQFPGGKEMQGYCYAQGGSVGSWEENQGYVVSIGAFIVDLMDEHTVRLLLKEHQDAAERLAQQQAATFQAQFEALRAELQAATGLRQVRHGGGGDQGALLPRSMRLDVPKFSGVDPESWLFSINEYFTLLNTAADQRLRIVGFNLEGAAAEWFRWMTRNGLITDWPRTVADYQGEFKKLMNRVTDISEALLISFYISGLKLPLQRELLVSKPTTLGDAFALARVTEARLEDQGTVSGANKGASTSGGSPYQHAVKMPLLPTPPKANVNPNAAVNSNAKPLAIKWISPAERQERLNKGLCFNCDNKWVRGHKCPGKFLLLMVDDGDDVGHDRDVVGADAVESGDISILNSLIGHGSPRSLQLWGTIGTGDVHVLIDNGSMHNFVRSDVVEKMCLPVQPTKAFKVYIGSGETLLCENVCSHVSLLMQGVAVDVDLYVLPMQGPDVVLGIQWLQHLGKVTHDYARQTMEFNLLGTTFTLKGDESLRMKKISLHRMQALLEQDGVYGVYEIYHLPLEADGEDTSLLVASLQCPEQDQLLGRFNDHFQVPNSLPPHCSIDHRIHLLPDTKPVNVRPYRYPHYQKGEMEKLVNEMLSQGIIRFSQSPFSSPVLLVKKKNGSYRFCVDYRALNAVTIKDKFPIPMADEMFDELGGATIFTKLDLRAGYHQIRVHERDVYKTVFRTHDGHYEFLVMPFGLTNAPSTFQATMNRTTFAAHLEHLECVLQRLQEHHFYVKRSKCVFGAETLEYLGHIISECGVAMDPKKVVAVREWSEPTTQRQVRGFLGLAGYYRRFIKGYATLAAPLTVFVVEVDASATGIGAVLLQNNCPISFFSRKLGPRMCVAATYQKELFVIVEAVYKWRQYLVGRRFIIRTDHKNLKELMQQVVQTPAQQKYVRKLMGFDFVVEYKPGEANQVADALSRLYEEEESVTASFMAISQPVVGLLEELKKENKTLEELVNLHHQIEKGSAPAGFRREQGFLVFQNRYFVGKESQLKGLLLREFHDTPSAGHGGVKKMLVGLSSLFYWPGMRRSVEDYIKQCLVCQQTKYSTQAIGGYLQPLPTPSAVWEDVSMDFITGLPASKGLTVILVVVDRFSKYAHFGPLPTSFNGHKVAEVFLDMVVKLHGIPKTIVSDRDPIFLSKFWTELFGLSGTQLNHSTAYHPQSDGQTEVVNRGLEQYLRAMASDRPQQWVRFLPWAEYCYNTSYHSSIKMSPFQAVYGRLPLTLIPYPPGYSKVAAVEELLVERDELLRQLKCNLLAAKHRMEEQANRKRRDLEFSVGDKVLVKLQPYRQITLAKRHSNKLAKRFYGPYEVVERIGKVAYRLALPTASKIHPVFHVSILKLFTGNDTERVAELPKEFQEGHPMEQPVAVCDSRMVLHNGKLTRQVLVQWAGRSPEEATWEWLSDFQTIYPTYNLEDKVISEEEGNVTPKVDQLGRGKRTKAAPAWHNEFVMD